MKKTNVLGFILVLALFFIAGCASMKKSVSYSFAGTDAGGTAAITFMNGVTLLDFEGNEFPKPGKGTRWDPLLFPAGKEFLIKVHVYDGGTGTGGGGCGGFGFLACLELVIVNETIRGMVWRDVYFVCPPLEAGKEYNLYFNSRSISRDSLELTEKSGKSFFRGKTVFEQKI
jgi:hypothetical protein